MVCLRAVPIRVAQGIRNVLWPMTFRRREALGARRQTVDDLGKDGATFSERCHFDPLEEVPALHSRRTVNQPQCEDWHLKCRTIGFVKGSSMSARTPLRLYRSVRGYPLERNGFPPQSLRSDCAMSGKTHVVGPLIPHPVLH